MPAGPAPATLDLREPMALGARAIPSRLDDQLARFEQVVTPCAPKVIAHYCGSNDLRADETPEAIFERFKAFSERVRRSWPTTCLIFVSSTRSPDRVAKWEHLTKRLLAIEGGLPSPGFEILP